MLKRENKAFRIEKHAHVYPHCWRTDKPVLYYPLDSWFIKTTALKEQMIELNKTIAWKPASTGEGRFGKWLENLVDWNLSRSRYWGTPLPVWTSEEGERKCIGSVKELMEEIDAAVKAGVMKENPWPTFTAGDYSTANYEKIDLHRPFVDDIVLVSPSGKPMTREKDLIDVWFDSGAMPYAQCHYPFENAGDIDEQTRFPADFIAEGVDQTRGWFFTLHAIAVMTSGSVAFKNIISNGLVLDAKGNKMSKRLGNAVDPFRVIEEHGADPLRWYMITNAQPWDNLKFDIAGVDEVKRKFFGTLYNTYSFFALYANIDRFDYSAGDVPLHERPEIDRWILSLLHSLVKEVTAAFENYEPTRAARAIQEFVIENLSNWYVRLSRKRYWGGEDSPDKLSAYQTLYACLETVAVLASPVAPFYMDRLHADLNRVTGKHPGSVHLTRFPVADDACIDKQLEERMAIAQRLSSMVLGLRRKVQTRVRQPLSRMLVPVMDEREIEQIDAVKNIILSEVNVKEIEYITAENDVLVKRVKPNFKTLGPKHGKQMKQVSSAIAAMTREEIYRLEKDGELTLLVDGNPVHLTAGDVEIYSDDIPGWLVTSEGTLTVALDVTVTRKLREEGIARELVNRVQNARKESNFNVTDKIALHVARHPAINDAVEHFKAYIASQVLAGEVSLDDEIEGDAREIEIDDIRTTMKIYRV
jgi:isoleucyl-tRNA synthetase